MGRKVKDVVDPVQPGPVCCANCGAPAGEVTLRRLNYGERLVRELEGSYICQDGCAKQRTRAMVRLIGKLEKEAKRNARSNRRNRKAA